MKKFVSFIFLVSALSGAVKAHDTWVESGPLVVPVGEYKYIDLRLGNHGNNHRDFKLASKITLAPCQVNVLSPDGGSENLISKMIDTGYAEKEGYWTTRYVPKQPGVYEVLHQLDTLHGTTRAIKSSKTYFVAQATSNNPAATNSPLPGEDNIRAHGLGLEMVPETPIAQLQAGKPVRLRLLRSGKPVADNVVSFIPRGATLSENWDPDFERKSDSEGIVEYTPVEGNIVLAVAHFVAADEKGDGYTKTHYGATMVLSIPQQNIATN